MKELFQGWLCCDLVSTTTSDGTEYKFKFNPGRLVTSILITAFVGTAFFVLA